MHKSKKTNDKAIKNNEKHKNKKNKNNEEADSYIENQLSVEEKKEERRR